MSTRTTSSPNLPPLGSQRVGSSPPPSPPSSASSAGASPPTITTPLIRTQPQVPQSFCIDALLRPTGGCASPVMSPPQGDGSGSSPPSSPASSPFGHRPTLVSPLFPTNPATGGSLYPYPGALLGAAGSAVPPTSGSAGVNSLESVLKNGMNMQTVQLEWLARTGMLYHRFPELAGNLSPNLSSKIGMSEVSANGVESFLFDRNPSGLRNDVFFFVLSVIFYPVFLFCPSFSYLLFFVLSVIF